MNEVDAVAKNRMFFTAILDEYKIRLEAVEKNRAQALGILPVLVLTALVFGWYFFVYVLGGDGGGITVGAILACVAEACFVAGTVFLLLTASRKGFMRADVNALLKAARPDASIASWAFRFLQSLPNVAVVLSGMTTMEQLRENLQTFSRPDPTTEAERQLLQRAVATMIDMVPCTACRYCCEGCPQSLDIPKLISMYNEVGFDNPFTLKFTLDAMKENELPAACVACGACTRLCPQGIDIPGVMKRFASALAQPCK